MNNIVILLGVVITVVTGIPVLIQLRREHPRGLFVLFFAEMWERFSYYGMRGLLIFFLTQHFLFDDKFANAQYGSYTSLVYLLPLIGGVLADRYLGTRKAIAFGALLLVAGHLTMAIEGAPARQTLTYAGQTYEVQAADGRAGAVSRLKVGDGAYAFGSDSGGLKIEGLPAASPLPATLPAGSYAMQTTRDQKFVGIFYLAISLIIMGVGFLKANISSIVGQLYTEGDPRRDPGFTLYYYGINLGAFWASVLCGYLGQTYGWSWGFGLAGVGMALGFVVFVLGKPWLEGHGEPPDPAKLKAPLIGPISREWLIYILAFAGLAAVWLLVRRYDWVGYLLGAGSVTVLTYVGWHMVAKCTKTERDRLLLAMLLVLGSVVFFTLFEQAGTSLNLFADRNTDLNVLTAPVSWSAPFGHVVFGTAAQLAAAGIDPAKALWVDMTVTAAQTQSFNAGFILIFAPMFAWLWAKLGKAGREPDPLFKFGLGLLQVGLGFLVLVWGAGTADASFRLPLILLGVTYLLHTTGELCLSPVGLSEITKLSPAVIVSTMMAVWFLASSWAQFIGGWIAGLAGSETVGGQVVDPALALKTSIGVFQTIGWWGIGFGVLFLALSPLLRRLAHGADDTRAAV